MIEVRPVADEKELQTFLRFPWRIYRPFGDLPDPHWVPPLISQIAKRLDVQRNPFFQSARRELFLAFQDGMAVGTIAGIVNDQHNRQHGERTGFFGFFECVADLAVASALLDTASQWLCEQGMVCIRGPVNGALTDELGLLVEGYRSRPAMWEGHNPPYYRDLLEQLGFRKFDDALAYEITFDQIRGRLENLPAKLLRAAQRERRQPDVRVRIPDMQQWDRELASVHEIYNNAFRSIPGHNDMSLAKFRSLVDSVRPFLDPGLIRIADVHGQPAGFAVALPDINEALRHFDGRISRLDMWRLGWHIRRIRTACFKLLGVLPEHRSRGLESLLIVEIGKEILRKRYRRVDISLASEMNIPMNRIIQRIGGRVYRRYRIYERSL